MNSAMLTVAVHGALSICLAVGGVLALRYGFVLFRDGRGSGRSAASIQFGQKFTAKANSVGAVVMITAAAWGALGVWALPNYRSKQEQVAYTFATSAGAVKAPELSFAASDASSAYTESELLGHFRKALDAANGSSRLAPKISGQPGKFTPGGARATHSSGKLVFEAPFTTASDTGALTYRAVTRDGGLVFLPEAAEAERSAIAKGPPNPNEAQD